MAECNRKRSLSPEETLLLTCASVAPEPERVERIRALIPAIGNWNPLLHRITRHRIASLLYDDLSQSEALLAIPESVRTYLHDLHIQNFIRNERIWDGLIPLFDALDHEEIDYLALKGLYLALAFYDDLRLRSLGVDVDLLFRKADLPRIDALLRDRGCQMTSILKRKDIESQLRVEGLTLRYRTPEGNIIEAHTALTPSLSAAQIDTEAVFARAMPFEARGRMFRTLSPTDLIVHLCLHLHKHLRLQGSPLIWWCDLSRSLCHFADDLNASAIGVEFERLGVRETASSVLGTANRWFSAPIPVPLEGKGDSGSREIESALLRDLKEGLRNQPSAPEAFVRRLGRAEGPHAGVRTLLIDLFPSPEFMMRRYRLRWKPLVYVFYPLRWLNALFLEIKRAWQRTV
jgi:hypothetical protein